MTRRTRSWRRLSTRAGAASSVGLETGAHKECGELAPKGPKGSFQHYSTANFQFAVCRQKVSVKVSRRAQERLTQYDLASPESRHLARPPRVSKAPGFRARKGSDPSSVLLISRARTLVVVRSSSPRSLCSTLVQSLRRSSPPVPLSKCSSTLSCRPLWPRLSPPSSLPTSILRTSPLNSACRCRVLHLVRCERLSNIPQSGVRSARPRDCPPAVGPRRCRHQPGRLRVRGGLVHCRWQHARVVPGAPHRRQVCARLPLPCRCLGRDGVGDAH